MLIINLKASPLQLKIPVDTINSQDIGKEGPCTEETLQE